MTRPAPCRICGMTGAHWSGCPAIKAASPAAGRARAALHANAQGGIVDVLAFEAAEYQACLDAVTIPYDPLTRTVLRGTCRGLTIESAVSLEMAHLLERHWRHVRICEVTVRPWWRGFRPTPARRIIPAVHLEEFTVRL